MNISQDTYTNPFVIRLLSELRDDEARTWFWQCVEAIREAFPKADQWTTGSERYVDVRIGKKAVSLASGSPVMYLFPWKNRIPALSFHKDISKNFHPSIITPDTHPNKAAILKYLNDNREQFKKKYHNLNGESNTPRAYSKTEKEEPFSFIKSMPFSLSKNLILYGPPGTGKTYNTIEAAISILDPTLIDEDNSRDLLKTTFDRYVANGQIVFTTFHQSFSYEDFIEGLRADTAEGKLEYVVEAGIFKRLCERAAQGVTEADDHFDAALEILNEKIEQAGGQLEMRTARGNAFQITYEGGKTFSVFPKASVDLSVPYTGNMNHVRRLYQSGDKSGIYNQSYVIGMLDYLKEQCGLPKSAPQPTPDETRKPFVLIIDEINRGNVSRIFGELITLIEPSKRAGMPEALEVTLPYSKERLSVPQNLYIIGTMNTADRSLTGLDIALRRRFEFREIPPRPELLDQVRIEGISFSAGEILRVMNQRIELLLDRDHCLGHAYFMDLKDGAALEALADVFRLKVLPLLQEYFFEDWQRIQWVLNDHRKDENLRFVRQPKSEVRALFGEVEGLSEQQRRWEINEDAFANPDAFSQIVSTTEGGQA